MATDTVSTSPPSRPTTVSRWAPRIVAFGEFVDGYDLLVVGAAALFFKPYFGLSNAETGWVTAIAFIGTAFGMLVFGDLADRCGRKVIFLINLAVFVVAALLSAFATDVWQLLVTRALVGIAIGMDIPTSLSFLAEVAPKARRGRLAGSLPNLMWLAGAIISVLLALAIKPLAGDDTWRWLFGLGAVPAAIALVARQVLPESPRWLRARGREADAQAAFTTLGIEPPDPVEPPAIRRYRALCTRPMLIKLLAVTGFFALQSFGGAVATVSAPLVLSGIGAGSSYALELSLAGYVVGIVAVLAGTRVIDKVNRRALGIWTCLAVFGAGLGVAFIGRHSAVALVAFFLAYSFLTWFGPGVLSWVWASEVFPTAIRGLGSGIVQTVTRLGAAGNVVLVPILVARFGLGAVALYALAYIIPAGIVLASPFLATTGKELEQV